MHSKPLYIATTFSILLVLVVIVLGAYTRLTDAGLGCPDWPGCYGHLLVPQQEQAAATFPGTQLESRKAWTEMIHRYVAGTLGLFIFGLTLVFIRTSTTLSQRFLAVGLSFLVIFQALLGMWTVTLKLFPAVVMAHLLGGLLLLSGLGWLRLSVSQIQIKPEIARRFKIAALIGLLLLFLQITSGGWVSANYAGLACVGFPACNGQLLPSIQLAEAFNPFQPLGINYEGGAFGSAERISIHMIHRIGALLTASYLVILAFWLLLKTNQRILRRQTLIIIGLIILQFSLGILNVVKLMPLSIAVAHNGVAALLLLAWITLIYYLFHIKKEEPSLG